MAHPKDALEDEIDRLEAAIGRMDEADPEEVDPAEYADVLRRLVALRELRD